MGASCTADAGQGNGGEQHRGSRLPIDPRLLLQALCLDRLRSPMPFLNLSHLDSMQPLTACCAVFKPWWRMLVLLLLCCCVSSLCFQHRLRLGLEDNLLVGCGCSIMGHEGLILRVAQLLL